jgi:Putative DNA-binding domain
MPLLADLQAGVRRAVTLWDPGAVGPLLVGGADPVARLAVHMRHYEASLVTAICGKFPATAWLAGADRVADAARAYVRTHPPRRPCIAEYGEDFPAFLGNAGLGPDLEFLQAFAELEWHVAQVSVAVDRTPVTWVEIVRLGPDALLNTRMALQPGLRYLRAPWALDQLMTAYLGDSAPERFVLNHTDTWIEIRGARGALRIDSLDPGAFVFRSALLGGQPLGDAAQMALASDSAFDAGQALAELVAAGLVTGVTPSRKGVHEQDR